jgi:7,8-dihydroneopterin aldolase/epimerase/oxygenase
VIELELRGLEVFGRHGALEHERWDGQDFLYDVVLEVPDDAARSDRLEDAVDYRLVADCVREVSDGRQFVLLEALADAVARALLERFPARRARVRVLKRKLALPVEFSAATVELYRDEIESV